jgi:hypothetical protein
VKLIELNPRWIADADIVIGGVARHFENRTGMAISFECPCCRGANGVSATRLAVWIANPIDGLPPTDDAENLWQRTGETFETLSLSPSIDASKHGHWHGFIQNGEVK